MKIALLSLLFSLQFLCAYEYEVAVAAIFQNEAPYLKEWIDYHCLIGVEHFWLYDDCSSDRWREQLQPYIEKGIVEVIDWAHMRDEVRMWPMIQVHAYRDALHRALLKAKWIALIDIDEFILPMQENNLIDCLDLHYPTSHAIYAQWLLFGTSKVTVNEGDSLLKNLTACAPLEYSLNAVGKSILRPEFVQIEKLWYPHHAPLFSSCIYSDGSGEPLTLKNDDLSVATHRGSFIRINHYFFRDEHFYRGVKLPRKMKGGVKIEEMQFLYEMCNQESDFTILEKLIKE